MLKCHILTFMSMINLCSVELSMKQVYNLGTRHQEEETYKLRQTKRAINIDNLHDCTCTVGFIKGVEKNDKKRGLSSI